MSNAVKKSVDGRNQKRESHEGLLSKMEHSNAESGLLCAADVFALEPDG